MSAAEITQARPTGAQKQYLDARAGTRLRFVILAVGG